MQITLHIQAFEFKKQYEAAYCHIYFFSDWDLNYLVNVFFKLKKLNRIVH